MFKKVAALAIGGATVFGIASGADAARNADTPWAKMTVVDIYDTPGPGGEITMKYRDSKRDGSCVRGILVNEDGSIYSMGKTSCGKWVNWTTWIPAEDWPRAMMYHVKSGQIG